MGSFSITILVIFNREEGATVDQGGQFQRWQSLDESETSSAGERQGDTFLMETTSKSLIVGSVKTTFYNYPKTRWLFRTVPDKCFVKFDLTFQIVTNDINSSIISSLAWHEGIGQQQYGSHGDLVLIQPTFFAKRPKS